MVASNTVDSLNNNSQLATILKVLSVLYYVVVSCCDVEPCSDETVVKACFVSPLVSRLLSDRLHSVSRTYNHSGSSGLYHPVDKNDQPIA